MNTIPVYGFVKVIEDPQFTHLYKKFSFMISPSRELDGGWLLWNDASLFCVYANAEPNTIPFYRYHATSPERFMISSDPNLNGGWKRFGSPIYAYASEQPYTIPVFQSKADDPERYLLSTSTKIPPMILDEYRLDKIAFYAPPQIINPELPVPNKANITTVIKNLTAFYEMMESAYPQVNTTLIRLYAAADAPTSEDPGNAAMTEAMFAGFEVASKFIEISPMVTMAAPLYTIGNYILTLHESKDTESLNTTFINLTQRIEKQHRTVEYVISEFTDILNNYIRNNTSPNDPELLMYWSTLMTSPTSIKSVSLGDLANIVVPSKDGNLTDFNKMRDAYVDGIENQNCVDLIVENYAHWGWNDNPVGLNLIGTYILVHSLDEAKALVKEQKGKTPLSAWWQITSQPKGNYEVHPHTLRKKGHRYSDANTEPSVQLLDILFSDDSAGEARPNLTGLYKRSEFYNSPKIKLEKGDW